MAAAAAAPPPPHKCLSSLSLLHRTISLEVVAGGRQREVAAGGRWREMSTAMGGGGGRRDGSGGRHTSLHQFRREGWQRQRQRPRGGTQISSIWLANSKNNEKN
uniref:Uncharacterized protein n=1 Tax=Oryza sativa subsp. japonica TaxID=39947 RepID=Q6ZDT3_ORYSJ|nr:hypothetical protein [Oryza sativa Japonica Group]